MKCGKKETGSVVSTLRSASIIFFCFICVLFFAGTDREVAVAIQDKQLPEKPVRTTGLPNHTLINVNNIAAWYDSNGEPEVAGRPNDGGKGVKYPRGTVGAVFTAGMIWGGLFRDGQEPLLRVNGQSYNVGTITGAILGVRTGLSEDPQDPDVRIWRIRRDIDGSDLRLEASEITGASPDGVTDEMIEDVRRQYVTDWLEWPAQKGAPFYDSNGDGVYTPVVVDDVPLLYPEADEPGIAGADQVIWGVCNDLGPACSPWGCPPSPGIEEQFTVWGYADFDDVIFRRVRLIYKGNTWTPEEAVIDSMYIGQWVDADLGGFVDDFAGCDRSLDLGFFYNGVPADAQYSAHGLVPPAIGYGFLQGPISPTGNPLDTALFDFRSVSGSINLPMTSFYNSASGGTYSTPPFNSGGAVQWYQVLRGFPPTPQGPPDPSLFINPVTGEPSKFWLDGDPVARTGWIDGIIDGPGDRRIMLSSGPFSMAVGDTQEVVIGIAGAIGDDYLNSVTRMKSNYRLASVIHNALYELPGPPAPPVVRALPFDREILLDWEFDSGGVIRVEDSTAIGDYRFEGYKVYQFPDESFDMDQAELIARFDIVNGVTNIQQLVPDSVTGQLFPANVQYGTDSGLERTLAVSADSLNGNDPLVNGRHYFFGVSAYNYTADSVLLVRTYESEPATVTVQPATASPGTRYPYSIGDTVGGVSQISGSNDLQVHPLVYNPEKPAGDVYDLSFAVDSNFAITWTLSNRSSGVVHYSDIDDVSGEESYRVQESGMDLIIKAEPRGVRSVVDEDDAELFGSYILSQDSTLEGFRGTSFETGEDYEIRFGEQSFAINKRSPTFFSEAVRVPFSVYDAGRGTGEPANIQVMVIFEDLNATGEWDVHPSMIGDSLFDAFEPLHISSFEYLPDNPSTPEREDSTAVKSMQSELIAIANQISDAEAVYSVFVIDTTVPEFGVIRFVKYHEVRHGDAFEITLDPVIRRDATLARNDVSAIKAFPNPFYGLNADETPSTGPFITFNHLPAKAVIRIYNLAGIHVRKLEKDDPQTQYYRWDLKNEHNRHVGSGLYIAYLELRDETGIDLGTKILKLAIIQRER